jgi:quercetin dioxygenase-like cupin family protein
VTSDLDDGEPVDGPVDLVGLAAGSGPLWGLQSEDLNATLLAWPPGHGVAEHTNDELEVIVVAIEGSALVTVGDREHQLAEGQLLLIPRGRSRAIVAGPSGVRYLSVHRRRGPLLPASRIREGSP